MADKLNIGSTTQNGQIAESELSYTPPNNEPGFDLKSAEKDFIARLLAGEDITQAPEALEEGVPGAEYESYGGSEDEFAAEVPDEDQDFPEDSLRTPVEGVETQEAPDEEEDPRVVRGVQRVIQRELAAKAREDAATAAEKRAEARIAELKRYEGLKSTGELSEQFELDPLGAMKSLGKDPDTIIKLALAQHLGDRAPENLKEFARTAADRREVAKIRAELAAERQARAQQEYVNSISTGAREYVTKNVDDVNFVKKYSTLAKAAKVDSQYVHDEIMEEIVKEARTRAAQDPDGEPISYDEAAKRVESRLARIAKLINAPGTNPAPKIGQKPRVTPPNTKAPAKPLAPWQKSSTEDEGWKVALRVYEQEEAKRKAARR